MTKPLIPVWCRRLMLFAFLVQFNLLNAQDIDKLETQFANPPDASRPGIFWYWLNGYVTEEGIDADLEAMKEAGIGNVMLFNIKHVFIDPSPAMEPVRVLSPEWRRLMKHALKKANELGMTVNLYNSMEGWSSTGGPGISPELAMQRITWSEVKVEGGKPFKGKLPLPRINLDSYSEIAVIAFPTPEAELEPDPMPVISSDVPGFDPRKLSIDPIPSTGFSSYCFDFTQSRENTALLKATKGENHHIQFSYEKPFSPRSLRIYPAYRTPWLADVLATGELQRSDDGHSWSPVRSFTLKGYTPLDLNFSAEPARYWRVVLSGERDLPLDELRLSSAYRIEDWTSKSFFSFRQLMQVSKLHLGGNPAPASAVIPRESIVDISSRMNAEGELNWKVPHGNWTILRFGHTPTGSEIRPAGSGAQGLENDKLSKESMDAHWRQAIQPWLDDPETRELFNTVHIDSYEAGSQNWTPKMKEEFRRRNDYDITPYLPVLIGRVVDSDLSSERFLWDFRQTVTHLVTENYFEHFRDLCHAEGKEFSIEPYGDNGALNSVASAAASDLPMAEHKDYYGTKLASSPAHLYEKPVVSVEAFTDVAGPGSRWETAFWDMKTWADNFLCGGVNHFSYHVYNAQPFSDEVKPGLTLGRAGTHFNRGHTWWPEMPAFSTYLSRCSHLLRQGRFVADVLFYYGEGAPKNYMFDKAHPEPEYQLPKGYDCDIGDLDVLLHRITVKNGLLTTPGGITYKLLVVPNESEAMTPALVKRIGELIAAGATVMAPRPELSPSRKAQPGADAYVIRAAEEIWGDCDGIQSRENSFGKGRVMWGRTLEETLDYLEIPAAVSSPLISGYQGDHQGWRWIQRKLKDGDLFFVMNPADKGETSEFSFRTEGTSPRWFDPVTGETRLLPEFEKLEGRVKLELQFAPRQSGFIFFASEPQEERASHGNIPEYKTLLKLEGSWDLSFDPEWGGPAKITFPELTDWSEHTNEGVKYYSGRASYVKTFMMPELQEGQKYMLDLGTVKNLANVTLNGKKLGTLWCAPWHMEIEPEQGENTLEIEVVNLWVNRLIGDEKSDGSVEYDGGGNTHKLPAWLNGSVPRPEHRYTFALYNIWKADSPLQPSGLLGPVLIKHLQND